MKTLPTISLDFDGVLNTYDGWKGEDGLFSPRVGAYAFLRRLSEFYVIVVHSTESDRKEARKTLSLIKGIDLRGIF